MHPESLEVVLWKNPGLLNTNCFRVYFNSDRLFANNFEFLQSALPIDAKQLWFASGVGTDRLFSLCMVMHQNRLSNGKARMDRI
jgi:hypothetical protein